MPTNSRYTEHCPLAPVLSEKKGFDDENRSNKNCNDEDQREMLGENQYNVLLLLLPALSTEPRLIMASRYTTFDHDTNLSKIKSNLTSTLRSLNLLE
jgi:hypothetical protein